MALGAGDAGVEHALLQAVDERAVLAVNAQDAVERLQGLEDLEGVGVVQAQVVIGEVGLERADPALAHDGEVATVLLAPLGQGHVEGVV